MIIFGMITFMYIFIIYNIYPNHYDNDKFNESDFQVTTNDIIASYLTSFDIKYDKFLAQRMIEEERKNDFLHILKRNIYNTFDNYI